MVTFVHASLVRTSHVLPPTTEDQEIQSSHALWSQRDGNTWWITLMRAVEELAMETQMGRGAVDIPDLLCSCIPELQDCGWCSLKIITSWTGSWKRRGEGRLRMNWTEHELCVRLCWMLEIQDGHGTYPKGVNNHLRNSKVWNSIRIWKWPAKERRGGMVCGCPGWLLHSLLLPQGWGCPYEVRGQCNCMFSGFCLYLHLRPSNIRRLCNWSHSWGRTKDSL